MSTQQLGDGEREELALELHGAVHGPDDDGHPGGLTGALEDVDRQLLNEAGAVDVDAAREQAERVVRLLERVEDAASN